LSGGTYQISLQYRLGAQVRYLAGRTIESALIDREEGKATIDGAASTGDWVTMKVDQTLSELISSLACSAESVAVATAQSDSSLTPEYREGDSLIHAKLLSLSSSLTAARIELRLAIKSQLKTEHALSELQESYDQLQKRYANLEKEQDDSDVFGRTARPNKYTVDLESEKKINQLERDLAEAKEQIRQLNEEVTIANAQKVEMNAMYAISMQSVEKRAAEAVGMMVERMQLEREEVLARMNEVYQIERELRTQSAAELQKELSKVREELYKSKHREATKEMEVAFLQAQLLDAADRINILMSEGFQTETTNAVTMDQQI
jgi:chromosome segregation ATPase